MVNVPFKSEDLLDEVFFFLMELLQLEVRTTEVSLCILNLNVKVPILGSHSLKSLGQLFDLQVCVSVVTQNILLLKFDSPLCLVSTSFPFWKLAILLLKKFVCVCRFAELLVNEPILPSKGLDVLSELGDLLRLKLC